MVAVDLPLLQEFIPASKRGWVSGLVSNLLPVGPTLAAVLSAFLGTVIGWRGLFAIGLLPALMAFVIRVWVPESPRWLIGQRSARRSRCKRRSARVGGSCSDTLAASSSVAS